MSQDFGAIDVQKSMKEISEFAEVVRDFDARLDVLDDDASKILVGVLNLKTEYMTDESLDAVIDALRMAYKDIRCTCIAEMTVDLKRLNVINNI